MHAYREPCSHDCLPSACNHRHTSTRMTRSCYDTAGYTCCPADIHQSLQNKTNAMFMKYIMAPRIKIDSKYKKYFGADFFPHLNLDKPTGVGEHCLATGHSVSKNNIKVLCREQEWHRHKVKAIHIKQQGPTMNHDQGYQLPPTPSTTGSFLRYLGQPPVRDQDL